MRTAVGRLGDREDALAPAEGFDGVFGYVQRPGNLAVAFTGLPHIAQKGPLG